MLKPTAYLASAVAAVVVCLSSYSAPASAGNDGVVRVKGVYPIGETISRLKNDIAAKGIVFFSEVDQSQLAAGAGIALRPSVLLTFGNPPLGTPIHHLQSERRPRLACAAFGLRERKR